MHTIHLPLDIPAQIPQENTSQFPIEAHSTSSSIELKTIGMLCNVHRCLDISAVFSGIGNFYCYTRLGLAVFVWQLHFSSLLWQFILIPIVC